MHDLITAQEILKIVLKTAEKKNLKKVTKIVIELGKIVEHHEELRPENLKFLIGKLAEKSVANGAKVVVKRVEGGGWRLVEIEGEVEGKR